MVVDSYIHSVLFTYTKSAPDTASGTEQLLYYTLSATVILRPAIKLLIKITIKVMELTYLLQITLIMHNSY